MFYKNTQGFNKLKEHIGHKVEVASYGNPIENIAIECLDCCEVLIDYEKVNK